MNEQRANSGRVDNRTFKKVAAKASIDIENLSAGLESRLEMLSEGCRKAVDAFQAVLRTSNLDNTPSEGRSAAIASLDGLLETFRLARESASEFRNVIGGIPKLGVEIIKAKRHAVEVLDKTVQELVNAETLFEQLRSSLAT